MSAAYKHEPPPANADPFAASRRLFDEVVMMASSVKSLTTGHEEVERAILEAGRGLLTRLFQDHLDLRSVNEPRVKVVDNNGVARSERRHGRRRLRSLLGPVVWTRYLYQQASNDGRAPADACLELSEDGFSMGVRKQVARVCASDAYAPAVETLERLTGVHVAQRQAEQLVWRAAQDVWAFYADQPKEQEPDDGLLVLSFDAAGVVMRKPSLRPATRKKAESEPVDASFPPKLESGKKANRKRMAQVGTVYSVAAFVRTAEDILGELQSLASCDDAPRPKRPRPVNKRLFASIARNYAEVIDQGFHEALARDPHRRRRWVVLLDGNPDQITAVYRAARRVGVEITLVADLIHLIEYLWPAAYAFHAPGSDQARAWVVSRVRALLQGANPSQVAAGMRRSATLQNIDKRQAVDACAGYMLKLAPYMRYAMALRDGLPIATGVIEGACRHLVRRRLDIGGARWSTQGAEAVLLLRAIVLSGDFDAYWAYHRAAVYQRVHATLYRGPVPDTRVPRAALRRVK
jgi:hypothetical protein